MIVQQVVSTVLTYLNAAGYYKSSEEVANALNLTSLDLFKRLRGNLAQYRPGMPISSNIKDISARMSCMLSTGGTGK
jgi:hypothetical protein